jgi:Spx/MgsR family transcriptional regulator
MTKIYGIKTCGSVRKAIKFFNDNNLEFEFVDFRKEPLDDSKIDFFASHIDINKLFNNKGTKYRDLKLKELNLDEQGKLEWLKKENMLLKRPVIEFDDNAICGFDEEVYKNTFL